MIDRRYPLEDVVEATKYVETEQKTGNVVLNVGELTTDGEILGRRSAEDLER